MQQTIKSPQLRGLFIFGGTLRPSPTIFFRTLGASVPGLCILCVCSGARLAAATHCVLGVGAALCHHHGTSLSHVALVMTERNVSQVEKLLTRILTVKPRLLVLNGEVIPRKRHPTLKTGDGCFFYKLEQDVFHQPVTGRAGIHSQLILLFHRLPIDV